MTSSDLITNDIQRNLRRPFTAAAVQIKPQTKPNQNGESLVTFYIDARLVAERLNECVGLAHWSDEYHVIDGDPAKGLPVECRLAVCGVVKADVGQIEPANHVDEKAWKSAYSDALKRAAVKFGVGAYLYSLPNIWAEVQVDQNGRARGFTKTGREAALKAYHAWAMSEQARDRFGDPFDHGDPERELHAHDAEIHPSQVAGTSSLPAAPVAAPTPARNLPPAAGTTSGAATTTPEETPAPDPQPAPAAVPETRSAFKIPDGAQDQTRQRPDIPVPAGQKKSGPTFDVPCTFVQAVADEPRKGWYDITIVLEGEPTLVSTKEEKLVEAATRLIGTSCTVNFTLVPARNPAYPPNRWLNRIEQVEAPADLAEAIAHAAGSSVVDDIPFSPVIW